MAEYDADKPPVEEDVRSEDHEFNPALEPTSAKAWQNLLQESEDAFEEWNVHCDRIDRNFASLSRLSQLSRSKEFQMFWANCEVLRPSIYAKAPVPVVVPKFKDRRPIYQEASEIMERCCSVAFDLTRINDLMLLVRDDLSMNNRGVAWCRYESGREGGSYSHEKVVIDFKGRRDFLHSISRNWREVTWVAAASYLTRSEARERFKSYSGDAYQEAEYKVDKDSKEIGGADNRERAKFWEIWHKGSRRVLWVAQGVEDILDEADPHLDLQNFFPCPKPAYGTVQRGSLIPVPDALQYWDQLEEVNLLTGRIHAISDALSVKGFYPAGGGELGDAIQAAIRLKSDGVSMVPIANWAQFGGVKDPVIWLPIDMIAQTITAMVMMRKQIIEDIYQITGMADIMRGATDPDETLGAQQLKTQYGSTRIRDKQQEMARLARDLVEITSEIITEKFADSTIVEMSQAQLPTNDDIEQEAKAIVQQLRQIPPQAQQDPQVAQQIQAGMQQLQQLKQQPTIDQVLKFLQDNRAKSFVLDIETDSTIMADEMGEKQRRTEFVAMLGGLLPQLAQMIQADPQNAKFCGEILKFSAAPYRASRQLDGSIDELVERQEAKSGEPQQPDPEQMKSQTQLQIEQMKIEYAREKDSADRQIKVAELQGKAASTTQDNQIDAQAKAMEVQGRQQEHAAKIMAIQQDGVNKQREHEFKAREMMMKAQSDAAKHDMNMQQAAQKASHADQMAQDRRAQQQFKLNQPPGGPI